MSIIGLTHSDTGEMLQRLAITTKVAIGEVVKGSGGTTHPKKLDHFVFLKKSTTLEWEPDQELIKHFTATCREFWIVLLDDEIENVFRTEYAWWSKTEKKCWGDGRAATRRTEKSPDGQDWSPCGDTCPQLEEGLCKPSGDLYFILADFPRLGSVCRLHTTSYCSIRQIYSALEQIRTVTGGRLAGIRCKLVVRPEKASYLDPKDKKKKSTTIYALNIELAADDMRKMLGEMTQYAQLFAQTKKLLTDGRKVEYVVDDEPEVERAPDIAQEFYPKEEAPAEAIDIKQPERASIPTTLPAKANGGNGHPAVVSQQQRMELFKACMEQGWSNDQVAEILKGEFGFANSKEITVDKYDEVYKRLANPLVVEPYQATDDDIPI